MALDSESSEGGADGSDSSGISAETDTSDGSVSSGDAVSKSSNLQAESLLINLDPQQREAATAIRGTLSSPADLESWNNEGGHN